jgi:hypothetical protein
LVFSGERARARLLSFFAPPPPPAAHLHFFFFFIGFLVGLFVLL